MAYPLDTAAQNAVLDSILGDGAGASMPSSFEVALFNGHPLLGGTELTSDGAYARVTIANDTATWPDASSGAKLSAVVVFATSDDAWSDTASHYLLFDAADSSTRFFAGRLSDEVNVSDAGTDVAVQLAASWNTASL